MLPARPLKSLIAASLLSLTLASGAIAQPGPGRGWFGNGPEMMMGPWGMMGGGMMRNLCSPRGMGFSEWRAARIERLVKPDDAQKAKLEDLKKAGEKAAEIMRAACPAEPPANPAARLEFMEKRTEAMLQAIKTVRPAFDAFYAALSDEQKGRLSGPGYGRRGR